MLTVIDWNGERDEDEGRYADDSAEVLEAEFPMSCHQGKEIPGQNNMPWDGDYERQD